MVERAGIVAGPASAAGSGSVAGARKLQLEELKLPVLAERIPYETIEVLVNHENVWANLQGHALTSMTFNVEDKERWLPFIEEDVFEPAPPRPFYSVGRVGPKLPPQRLEALRQQLRSSIRTAYFSWRQTRNLKTRWLVRLEPTLNDGLATYEMAACSSQLTDARAVDKWRGYLTSALPPDQKFVGRAFTFSITTPELITEYLMTNYDYHTQGHKDVSFVLAVQCFPHYGAVSSIWVYVGYVVPHAKDARKKKAKQED